MEDSEDLKFNEHQIRDRDTDRLDNFFWTTEVAGQNSLEIMDLELEYLQND